MRIDIITIFPDYFTPLDLSLIGKARRSGLIDVRLHDLRRWTYDRHHTVDDTPYGGGPGMVMKPEPWGRRWMRSPLTRTRDLPADPADAERTAFHPAGRGPVGEGALADFCVRALRGY